MRRFNTAGPCLPGYHYMVPPLNRLPEAPDLVDQMGYLVVHAPRQTGKTTAIWALAEALTASGRYTALAFTCETGGAAADDYGAAQRGVLGQIRSSVKHSLPKELQPPPWPDASAENLLHTALQAWAGSSPRPLVLFLRDVRDYKAASGGRPARSTSW